jgi:hypothetical protein
MNVDRPAPSDPEPPLLADARGTTFAAVGARAREVAADAYAHHAAGGHTVFPVMLSPAPAAYGPTIPAIHTTDALTVGMPGASFRNQNQLASGISHIKQTNSGRLLLIVAEADALSAYTFNRLITRLKDAVGTLWGSRTRLLVLYDEGAFPPPAPFHEAAVFQKSMFLSSAMVAEPAPWRGRDHAGDEVLAELMDRVGARYGPDPSDPWVAAEVLGTSSRRLPDAEALRRAVGDAIMAEEAVPIMAATRTGLDAAVTAVAKLWAGADCATLVAGFSVLSRGGDPRDIRVSLPFSEASRGHASYFATVLSTTADYTPIERVGGSGSKSKAPPVLVPRGTTLWWDGEMDDGTSIVDESTIDAATGAHFVAPPVATRIDDSPAHLCCWVPAQTLGDAGSGTTIKVRVPVFQGDPAGPTVRPVGISVLGTAETASAPVVVGHVLGTPAPPGRMSADAVVSAEPFSVAQYGAVLRTVARRHGAARRISAAPVAGARFSLNLPAPYGTAEAVRAPGAAEAAIGHLVKRRKVFSFPL